MGPFSNVGREHEPTAIVIDSQSVKTAEASGERGFDGGKHVDGRKRQMVVDTEGNLLTVTVHAARRGSGSSARRAPPLHLGSTAGYEDVGYTVMTAGDGLEALTDLRQSAEVPKVILLDVAMPLMTGWVVAPAPQSEPRFVAIPIVIMTALSALEHNEIPDGAVAFLEKPLDLVALEMILRAYAEPRLRVRAVGG